jgi:flagellar motor switch/type III secretory pathway protein FliN
MTNSPQLPQEATELIEEAQAPDGAQRDALMPCLPLSEQEPLRFNSVLARLPVEVDVAVPVRRFRLRNLVDLQVGQVIATQWEHTEDLPLSAGDVQLAWTEFEVTDSKLGVRITRLA